jgi:hypothetical protein
MALEMFDPKWIGADLFCDGLGGPIGTCVLGDDGPAMISDIAPDAEDARRLALCAAERSGWRFDITMQRWLCPACLAALAAGATVSDEPR